MKASTSRFGEVDVSDDSIVTFPFGLVGLPQHTRFVVFDVEQNSGYQWLQSLEDETLAVVITQADLIQPDFSDLIAEENIKDLEVKKEDQVAISVIVTIPAGHPERATVNLRAPILVNLRTRIAKQIILHESIPLHFPLFVDQAQEKKDEHLCVGEAVKTS